MRQKIRKRKFLSLLIIFTLVLSILPTTIAKAASSGAPGKPVLTSNQYGTDYDGNYTITMNMYYGNNATSYKVYERFGATGEFKLIGEGKLTDNTPSVQTAVFEVTGRTSVGMYNYRVDFINSYGTTSSDILQVRVGKEGNQKIIINGIDDQGIQCQMTIGQNVNNFKMINTANANPKFSVISSNTSTVKASITNGDTLIVQGIAAGRSGIKVIDEVTGDIRQIGVRVKNADGSLPGMPNYLSIGQVSEDTDNDLNFWKQTSNDDTNKRCDVRYIYVNGGPFGGWRSWTSEDGDRVKNYIRETLKVGMIPFFVYYNVPDMGESYDLDAKHISDKAYMEGYYKDLKYFLDICNEYAKDETVGMVFEPDFLGYMMKFANKAPNEINAVVDAAYTSGVLQKDKDPKFENSVKGFVESINYIVRKNYKQSYFGWQFNIWSYDSTEITTQGLLHKTEFIGWDAGRNFIKQVAKQTADFYKSAGILSQNADFISIDKYGQDGAYQPGAAQDPKSSAWFWNADIWNNYLLYTKVLHEETQKPVILWQIPVGHINHSYEPNPYNGGSFNDLSNKEGYYEDSAPDFFFGDTFSPGAGNRLNYFGTNAANDPKVKTSGDKVTWGGHMEETRDAGVISILFGAGVNSSTDAVGSPPQDDYWWITKAQRYLKNPLPLNGVNPGQPSDDYPLKGSISSSAIQSNGNYTITINIPANSKATSYSLLENGTSVKSGIVDPSANTIKYEVVNKPTGSYMYALDLANGSKVTSSNNLTVIVNNNVVPPIDEPLKGKVSVDKVNNDGNYTVTLSIPAKSNATSYNLLENGSIIKTGTVSGLAQDVTVNIKGKSAGEYTYRLDLINKDKTTSSDEVKVVCKPTSLPDSKVNVEFAVTSDWGSGANFTITVTNNTNSDLQDWKLKFDFAKRITSVPDANFTASGNSYILTPKVWNSTLRKGEKITFSGGCEGNVKDINIYNVKFESPSLISGN
ncbi:Cellulose binding domain-containing protein [Clostridium cavendishii DSM 21758]|uniref:Cellulose binding domain-containing protein n=1 Tax=Clostridium cavendishii DSM 21758 TaxID=1121302 RepID=A0A1M6GI04_9CLOT|nr:cellulose binding domain-containing protein [Clostridium cavendishii]SHJ09569.1 Cellulose binding domain-containing protein [Clostridium cavendishii DSM 21758]